MLATGDAINKRAGGVPGNLHTSFPYSKSHSDGTALSLYAHQARSVINGRAGNPIIRRGNSAARRKSRACYFSIEAVILTFIISCFYGIRAA